MPAVRQTIHLPYRPKLWSHLKNGVTSARAAYERMMTTAKEFQRAVTVAHTGATSIRDAILWNAEVNSTAAFEAAQALSRATTLQELMQVHANFVQHHLSLADGQAMDFLRLSARVSKDTADAFANAFNPR